MSEKAFDTALSALQDWYHSNCDGDWEHEFGIKIQTLDNPGWTVSIPLAETALADRPFEAVRWDRSSGEWLFCRVEDSTFRGQGGSQNLTDIIQVFLDWARQA